MIRKAFNSFSKNNEIVQTKRHSPLMAANKVLVRNNTVMAEDLFPSVFNSLTLVVDTVQDRPLPNR